MAVLRLLDGGIYYNNFSSMPKLTKSQLKNLRGLTEEFKLLTVVCINTNKSIVDGNGLDKVDMNQFISGVSEIEKALKILWESERCSHYDLNEKFSSTDLEWAKNTSRKFCEKYCGQFRSILKDIKKDTDKILDDLGDEESYLTYNFLWDKYKDVDEFMNSIKSNMTTKREFGNAEYTSKMGVK